MTFPVSLCVNVFIQVITLEGWVEIMYYVMDAHSFYNFIYFILLIIVSQNGSLSLWQKRTVECETKLLFCVT